MSFAEWVFGPGGLPALQVLAFGDFSHSDRYSGQQFLLRRAFPAWECGSKDVAGDICDYTTRLPFRPADMADPSIWDGVGYRVSRQAAKGKRASRLLHGLHLFVNGNLISWPESYVVLPDISGERPHSQASPPRSNSFRYHEPGIGLQQNYVI